MVVLVSCATKSSRPPPPDEPLPPENADANVPAMIRDLSVIQVQETKRLIGMSVDQITLSFQTTNRFGDSRLYILGNFAKTSTERSNVSLHLRTPQKDTVYGLTP